MLRQLRVFRGALKESKMIQRMIMIAAVATIVMINGCSAPMVKRGEDGVRISIHKQLPPKKIQSIVTKAGQKEGWIMTPLNSRSIVASKYVEGKSASVVLNYNDDTISIEKNRTTMSDSTFEDEVEDLQEAIAESLH